MGAERPGRELTGRGAAVLRAWRFLTLVLAALALTMTSAHVLELPQKMAYPPGHAFAWALVGASCLLLAFGSWLALVEPVNREIAGALRTSPDSVPSLWMRLRPRWEYGHATGFVIQLAGFCALLVSVLVETPGASLVGRGSRTARADTDRRAA